MPPLPEVVADHSIVVVTGIVGDAVRFDSVPMQRLIRWLDVVSKNETVTLMCVCAGSVIAAKAGLLHGRECTTHHEHIEELMRVDPSAIVQQGGKLSFNQERVWVDVFAFEQAIASSDSQRNTPLEDAFLSRAIELYQGSFLNEDGGEAWPVATRERLRGRFIHALSRHAERLENRGEHEGAINIYLRGLDADPMMEAFYQGLMRCYAARGRPAEAVGVYRRLRQTLSVVLGVPPSVASESLHRELLQNPAAHALHIPPSVTGR